ncbi:MAG: DNA polymerase III subunit delta [Clostridia bacterium]|nr:MAG: DNA polymerase III subunit delta [Clostridia bacterium]
MLYAQWLGEIDRGHIAPVYLLVGPETYLQREAVDTVKSRLLRQEMEAFNFQKFNARETAPDYLLTLVRTPAWGGGSRVLVLENAAGNREWEKALVAYMENPFPGACLLITGGEEVQGTGTLVKAGQKKGWLVECKPLKGEQLAAWLRQRCHWLGLTMAPAAVEYLVATGSGDLAALAEEVEKCALYVWPEKNVTLQDVQEMTQAEPEATIFRLVDAVGLRQIGEALVWLRQLLSQGEPPLRAEFMIGRQLRLLARAGHSQGNPAAVAKELGVPEFVARKLGRQVRNYTPAELAAATERLLEVDLKLKRGADAPLVLELFLLSLAPGSRITL